VEEAVAAGLDDVLMITGRNKRSLEDHFDRQWELEAALEAKGDLERPAQVRESADLATVHYVRQGDPRGLGHAVLCASSTSGDAPFAVLLGDDLIDARDPLLTTMIEVQERHGGSVLALIEVPPAQISLYGSAAGRADRRGRRAAHHRPGREARPGERAEQLRRDRPLHPLGVGVRRARATAPGRGGEIQLTDALSELVGVRADARRRVHRPALRHR
jgi:UTP--glucose-1-phosphate uridylyltransferase